MIEVMLADGNGTVFSLVAENKLVEDDEGVGLPFGLNLITLGCFQIDHKGLLQIYKPSPLPGICVLLNLLGVLHSSVYSDSNYPPIP